MNTQESVQSRVCRELLGVIEDSIQRLLAYTAEQAALKPSPEKWSKKEILGHLIDSAANNHQRFVRAQYTDPLILPKYEQDDWVRLQAYQECEWEFLVNLWASYNLHLAHVIGRISDNALGVQCKIGAYQPASLEFIVTDYVEHLKHHLRQLEVHV